MTFDGRVEAYFTVPTGLTISVQTSAPATTLPVTVTAGTYAGISAFLAALQAALIAGKPLTVGTWQVSLSTGASGTGKVTIATTAGTYGITWGAGVDQAALRDLLGFAADIGGGTTTTTSPKQARGLWIPDCPVVSDVDAVQAPLDDDASTTVSPTGKAFTRSTTSRYTHSNIKWSFVSKSRMWASEEAITNQSYERFHRDAIRGRGHRWFRPGAKVDIWDHLARKMGSLGMDGAVSGWVPVGVPKPSELKKVLDEWTGAYRVEWPLAIAESTV